MLDAWGVNEWASALAIVSVITSVGVWMLRRRAEPQQGQALVGPVRSPVMLRPPVLRRPRYDLELYPLSFELRLHLPLPDVVVTLLLISYVDDDLPDCSVSLSRFSVAAGSVNAELVERDRPLTVVQAARFGNATEVHLTKRLNEFEVRLCKQLPELDRYTASFACSAKVRRGRKDIHFRTDSYGIDGRVFFPAESTAGR
ncbi:MAG: hypothetical protein ABR505_08985 [Actinomycetota bacterium]